MATPGFINTGKIKHPRVRIAAEQKQLSRLNNNLARQVQKRESSEQLRRSLELINSYLQKVDPNDYEAIDLQREFENQKDMLLEQYSDLERQRDCIKVEAEYARNDRNSFASELHSLKKDVEEMRVHKSNEQHRAIQMSNDIAQQKGELVRLREIQIFNSKMHQMEIENITGGIPPELVHKMQHEKAKKMQVDEKLEAFQKQYSAVLRKQKMLDIERLSNEVTHEKNQIEFLDEDYERKLTRHRSLEVLVNTTFEEKCKELRERQSVLTNSFNDNNSEYQTNKRKINEEILKNRMTRSNVLKQQDVDKEHLDHLIQMNLRLQSEIMVYKATIDATFGTMEEGIQFNHGFMPPHEIDSRTPSRIMSRNSSRTSSVRSVRPLVQHEMMNAAIDAARIHAMQSVGSSLSSSVQKLDDLMVQHELIDMNGYESGSSGLSGYGVTRLPESKNEQPIWNSDSPVLHQPIMHMSEEVAHQPIFHSKSPILHNEVHLSQPVLHQPVHQTTFDTSNNFAHHDDASSLSDFPSRKSSVVYHPIAPAALEPAIRSDFRSRKSSSSSNSKQSVMSGHSTISGHSHVPSLRQFENHPVAAVRVLEFDERSDASSSFTHDTMSTAHKDLQKKGAHDDDILMQQLRNGRNSSSSSTEENYPVATGRTMAHQDFTPYTTDGEGYSLPHSLSEIPEEDFYRAQRRFDDDNISLASSTRM